MLGIYDIYEDGVATPANTTGMGNPQAPQDGECGSEPLCGTAKCKKEKKKKNKDIKEGIFDDKSVAKQKNSMIFKIADFIVSQPEMGIKDNIKEQVMSAVFNAITLDNVGFSLDIKAFEESSNYGQLDFLYVPKQGLPDWFKLNNVYNAKGGYSICTHTGDLSNLNLTVWADDGKSYADLSVSCKIKTVGESLTLGKIECYRFMVNAPSIESISFDKDSIMIGAQFGRCSKLQNIYGFIGHADSVVFPKNFVKSYMAQHGLVGWGTNVIVA